MPNAQKYFLFVPAHSVPNILGNTPKFKILLPRLFIPGPKVSIKICYTPIGQQVMEEIDLLDTGHFWPRPKTLRLADLTPLHFVVSKCLIVWLNQSVFQATIYLLSSMFVAQFRIITKMLHRIWKHLTSLTFVHAFLKQIPSNWKEICISLRCSFTLLFSV